MKNKLYRKNKFIIRYIPDITLSYNDILKMWMLAYSSHYDDNDDDDNPYFSAEIFETKQDANNFIYENRRKMGIIQYEIKECKVGCKIDIDGDVFENSARFGRSI
jgi:hypothetical protein